MWRKVRLLILLLTGCGQAQLDTITGLSCPVSDATGENLIQIYGLSEADGIMDHFCP